MRGRAALPALPAADGPWRAPEISWQGWHGLDPELGWQCHGQSPPAAPAHTDTAWELTEQLWDSQES